MWSGPSSPIRLRDSASPPHRQAASAHHRFHRIRPFDVAWSEQQLRGRVPDQECAIGIHQQFFLDPMCAAGDQQRSLRGQPQLHPRDLPLGRSRQRLIEFDVACAMYRPRIRPECNDPFRVAIGLHQAQPQRAQHALVQPPDGRSSLTCVRLRRQSAIDHDRRNASTGQLPKKIWPQLGFNKHVQRRPQPVDRARDRPGKIQRSIQMLRNACQQLLDGLTSGLGGRGDRKPMVGMPSMEFANQRRDGHYFPQRDRMHPDERSMIRRDVRRGESEPLR